MGRKVTLIFSDLFIPLPTSVHHEMQRTILGLRQRAVALTQ